MPDVSVIMPVYNGMPFVREALGSLLGQTLRDIEVIVLDDASTDGTSEYLDSICDERLRVFKCPKQGYAPLLNYGLTLATAPYAARMDADDVSLPQRLERQLQIMRDDPDVVVCGCQAAVIDRTGSGLGHWSVPVHDALIKFRLLGAGDSLLHPGVMYRVADVRAVGGYDVSLVPAEDYDLWWRLIGRGKFANSSEPLLRYRVHQHNISLLRARDAERHREQSAKRHIQRLGLATSEDEAGRFAAFMRYVTTSRLAGSVLHPDISTDLQNTFLPVFGRYCRLMNLQVNGEALDLIRRELRWAFLRCSSRWSWASRERFLWIMAARQIDPHQMSFWRLAQRAIQTGWRAIRTRGTRCASAAGGKGWRHSDVSISKSTCGGPSASQSDARAEVA